MVSAIGSDNKLASYQFEVIEEEEETIPDGTEHIFRFDEGSGSTAGDSVGDADGSISGAQWVSGTGYGDYVLRFDGGEVVDVSGILEKSIDEFTCSFWMYVEDDDDDREKAFQFGEFGDDETIWLNVAENGGWRYGIRASGSDTELFPDNPGDQNWYHIVCSFKSGEDAEFYRDGVLRESTSFSGTVSLSGTVKEIGKRAGAGNDRWFIGDLDNFMIGTQQWSASTVDQVYEEQRDLYGV